MFLKFWPTLAMSNSEGPDLRSFRDSEGEWVEVLVEEEEVEPTRKVFPKGPKSNPVEFAEPIPKEISGAGVEPEEVAEYRRAPRLETHYPSQELHLARKAAPGYKVLPTPKTQRVELNANSAPSSPPKRRRVFDPASGSVPSTSPASPIAASRCSAVEQNPQSKK